jgi:hypothetical protein
MVRPPVGALPRLDEPAGARPPVREPWVALVVDDDPEVHTVTRLCFAEFEFEGRALALLSAHSAAQARTLLKGHPEIALVRLAQYSEELDRFAYAA